MQKLMHLVTSNKSHSQTLHQNHMTLYGFPSYSLHEQFSCLVITDVRQACRWISDRVALVVVRGGRQLGGHVARRGIDSQGRAEQREPAGTHRHNIQRASSNWLRLRAARARPSAADAAEGGGQGDSGMRADERAALQRAQPWDLRSPRNQPAANMIDHQQPPNRPRRLLARSRINCNEHASSQLANKVMHVSQNCLAAVATQQLIDEDTQLHSPGSILLAGKRIQLLSHPQLVTMQAASQPDHDASRQHEQQAAEESTMNSTPNKLMYNCPGRGCRKQFVNEVFKCYTRSSGLNSAC